MRTACTLRLTSAPSGDFSSTLSSLMRISEGSPDIGLAGERHTEERSKAPRSDTLAISRYEGSDDKSTINLLRLGD